MTPELQALVDKISSAIEKATQGKWAFATYSKKFFGLGQAGSSPFFMLQCRNDTTADVAAINDATYIALCNPANMRLLLSALKSEREQGIRCAATECDNVIQCWSHEHKDGTATRGAEECKEFILALLPPETKEKL